MEKREYQMIVLDIDGTLTNSRKEITAETKEALMKVQRLGKKVVLASGRPTPGVIGFARELEMERYGGYILSFNGGRIHNVSTGELVYNRTLPQYLIGDIYKEAVEAKLGIITYTESEIILGNGEDEYTRLEARINGIPTREVEDFVSFVDFPVNKCLMTGAAEPIEAMQTRMREKFGWELNIFRSEPFFLEIMPQSVDKAYSLGRLLESLGITREQLICCGDGFNDRSMIHFAGLGVAMANAQQEVKDVADYITASNDENGIVEVVEKFLL